MGDATLWLRSGRERSLQRRHPWIFSGAVERVDGSPGPGDTVIVRRADGAFCARAAWSPSSQIRARVWSFDEDEHVDEAFLGERVRAAAARRDPLAQVTDGVRLVHGENDLIPGLVADRYGSLVVVQFLSAGTERWRDALVEHLAALPGVDAVFERSDVDVRHKEGLRPKIGVVRGDPPPETVEIHEHGWRFAVDVRQGHKTGFYLDQRDARRAVASVASGARVLNLFSYTGGFAVAALTHGADAVVNVDSSGPALRATADNVRRNLGSLEGCELVEADVFETLRRLRDAGERFDVVVCDPPKFAASDAQVTKATRAYKDINLLGLLLLRPGGHLFTFSCSGAVSEELFQKVVFGASSDAGRDAQIVGRLSQPSDHPVLLSFPEGAYLKGLVCRVV